MPLTEEEKAKIKEEENYRTEARKEAERKPLLKQNIGCGGFILIIIIIIVMIVIFSGDGEKKSTELEITQPSQEEIKKTEAKKISYEIVERWSIPNGGEVKVIVISPEYLNETDMVTLGEKLKNDTKNDRNAFIFVFTDKKAAASRDKGMLGELSKIDQDFYDKNYVGQYDKNGNTGYHQFAIYFDGAMGTNYKTIEY